MKILITGAKGFVGKNLVYNLLNIKDGKNRTRPGLKISELFEYDIDTPSELLRKYCAECDFVFNLAGVNRPKNEREFMEGNFGFAESLLRTLKACENPCPVMLSSSIQASLKGRYENSAYGESKSAGEELFFRYSKETWARVLVYRFPNLFGKWCRPNYNSAVATFCSNIANNLPIRINDGDTRLELLYIDDLIDEMLDALEGREHRCNFDGEKLLPCDDGRYCYVPLTYSASLSEITDLLYRFHEQPESLLLPDIPDRSFAKKLYSTYLSYLPKESLSFAPKMNTDERGSFTELMKFEKSGQLSLNITKAKITKGEHWHNSKWEIFIVVSGHALIRERKIGSDEVLEFEVSGERPEAVYMLPGYTHSITNLSDSEDLVTLMWANEQFDAERPDTFFEKV